MFSRLKKLLRDEKGVTAIEYGLIAAFVAIGIIAAVTALGTNLQSIFNEISTSI